MVWTLASSHTQAPLPLQFRCLKDWSDRWDRRVEVGEVGPSVPTSFYPISNSQTSSPETGEGSISSPRGTVTEPTLSGPLRFLLSFTSLFLAILDIFIHRIYPDSLISISWRPLVPVPSTLSPSTEDRNVLHPLPLPLRPSPLSRRRGTRGRKRGRGELL